MKNLNMKRSKRLTGMVCMMLSIFLLTMPLLGMAAAQDVSGNDAPACICDTKCSVETPNQECPVCKENADACKGQAAEPNTLPCFCEKKCTKGDHNTECPTCAADMDLCTAPPAGEPAACICTVLCQEGAVNPDCAVCQSDRAQCIGKAPDTSTEPEQPTEPDTPTEPEPPAEPEKCTCTDKCAAGAVNTGCEICKNDLTKCEGKEPEVVDPKFTISILAPDGWYTNRANVEIRIKDIEGMVCMNCVKHVDKALREIQGIREVSVSLENKSAQVQLNQDVPDEVLKAAIEDAGYQVVGIQ